MNTITLDGRSVGPDDVAVILSDATSLDSGSARLVTQTAGPSSSSHCSA